MEFHPTDVLLEKPILFNQLELNDLVRDLYLPKQYAELLASRFNEKILLSNGTSVTYYRSREASFRKYFSSTAKLCIAEISKDFFLRWVLLMHHVIGDCSLTV